MDLAEDEVDRGRRVDVMAATGALSSLYTAPRDGVVSLYRIEPPVPPATEPRRVPVAEARLGAGGPWLVLMAAKSNGSLRTEEVRLMVVDDSWAAHPEGTARVFNFSRRPAMVMIAGATREIAPGASDLFSYGGGGDDQSWVKVAMREETGWMLRSSGPQATIPGTRSTLVLVDTPPSADDPDPRTLVISNLVDAAPRPTGLARLD